MMDIVHNPENYIKGRRYQPLDVMEDLVLVQNKYLACEFKYISRCGRKDDAVTDLKKAIFYLECEIKRRENANIIKLHS